MLYQVTFKGTETKPGEDPQQIRKVAYVQGTSTTEAAANLLDGISKNPSLNIKVDSVESISKASVTEIHFDDTKEDIFFRFRIGFKDASDRKFKYQYVIVQADDLLEATSKADQIGKDNPAAAYTLYSATQTENLCCKDLLGDYAV